MWLFGIVTAILGLTGCPPDPEIGCLPSVNPGTYEILLDQLHSTGPGCRDVDPLGVGFLSMTISPMQRQFDCWANEAEVTLPGVRTTGPAPYSISGTTKRASGCS
jgi:hypothetical protein